MFTAPQVLLICLIVVTAALGGVCLGARIVWRAKGERDPLIFERPQKRTTQTTMG